MAKGLKVSTPVDTHTCLTFLSLTGYSEGSKERSGLQAGEKQGLPCGDWGGGQLGASSGDGGTQLGR